MSSTAATPGFGELGLSPSVLQAVSELGYEQPSPIQEASIPVLLAGNDLLGQAQTGTGKTAAFALPMLSRIDLNDNRTQLLVLAPTRELAIQVAEAFQSYARHMPRFHVLPVYGGQAYGGQLKQLRQGAQVVVGTPGRVMDHIRKGTLKLDALRALVLDEADEMLRMGFIDDVEWILEQTPGEKQTALFSATMPEVIRRVAHKYLKSPQEIRIASKTSTATTIRQRFWQVSGFHKIDALTRIMDVEEFDAMIVFVRTKNATVEVADKLQARGFDAAALNGDIPQGQREQTVDKLKKGKLDIIVATDVAARGLDVERISHVINYDIPYDTEAYVHRIGRTGRAGRQGDAILFVTPRERRMLSAIERATKQKVERFEMPSTSDINAQRVARFKRKITDVLSSEDLEVYTGLISELQSEEGLDPLQIAAALAHLAQGDDPLLLDETPRDRQPREHERKGERDGRRERAPREPRENRAPRERGSKPAPAPVARPLKDFPDMPMERYKVAVGYQDEVRPGSIVGAIANEAEIDSCYIGEIHIQDDYTTVDLPADMPKEILRILQKARVCGKRLDMQRFSGKPGHSQPASIGDRPVKKKAKKAGAFDSKSAGGKPKKKFRERKNSK
ncbi:DEAD/DEAH box helicase [Granulosicoccaceae sp. 1_MG-2023]|nr:DEAD/DEAH box helicase [Granulosicoccaceae sp. 1_MG-2023]